MASRLVRALIVGGGAAAALAIGIGSAAADDPTWTVTAGSAAIGSTVTFTGTTTGPSPQIAFSDVTSGIDLNCDAGTASGSALVGSGQPGAGIAKITGTTWTHCVGPLGIELDPSSSTTWSLNGISYAGGVTTGTISEILAHVANPDGQCSFDVTGLVNGTYDNATQNLAVSPDPTLTISNVSGCFGLLNEQDQATFAATYHVVADVAANNPIQITSP